MIWSRACVWRRRDLRRAGADRSGDIGENRAGVGGGADGLFEPVRGQRCWGGWCFGTLPAEATWVGAPVIVANRLYHRRSIIRRREETEQAIA